MGMMWKFDAGQELKRSLVYLNGSFESFAHRCGIEPERLCRILNYEECATENEIENIAEQSVFLKNTSLQVCWKQKRPNIGAILLAVQSRQSHQSLKYHTPVLSMLTTAHILRY